jgi:transposase-like protein
MNKGIGLIAKGYVRPVDSSTFGVRSETDFQKWYVVRWNRKLWECSCEDFKEHGRKCKHVYAVLYYLSLQDIRVGVKKMGQEVAPCPLCGLSDAVIKDGFSENRSGFAQRFFCKKCRKGFSPKTGFEGAHGQAFAIVVSLDLYYRGLSLRQISEHFGSVYGITVSHGTIYCWIKRYVELVYQYVNKTKVTSGERWHADETVVRVKGKHLHLWGMLDGETRILLAHNISETRGANQAYKLIDDSLKKSKNRPKELVTDSLGSYSKAVDARFGEELKKPLVHVQASISSPLTNNKMERFQRTVKARFKAMGTSFDNNQSAEVFMKGFSIHYNNIRKHRSLNSQTPMEVSGKDLGNSWAKLVRNAQATKVVR